MLGWSGVPVSQGRARAVGAFTRAWGTEMLSHTLEDVVPADFGPAVMVCRSDAPSRSDRSASLG